MTRFRGTGALVRLILRRDRIRLPVWILALVAVVGSSAAAVQGLYATEEARAGYAATVGSSGASIAMSGPPTALDTAGGITVFEVATTAILGIALMAVFLTLRHTRTDEEAGRTELLRAGVLGRNADLAATGIVVSAASLVVGLGVTGTFLAAGLPTSGSVLYGLAIASVGLVFTAAALVAAQIAEHSRAATGLALSVLAVAFLVRAIGDVGDSWLSWLSPIGWAQQVAAFGEERWWPLTLTVVLALVLAGLAGWLTTRRDIGAGLVAPRPGPAAASARLGTPLGLAVRLQRGSIIGWSAGLALLGVAFGSLGQDVQDMISGNPELEEIFLQQAGGASITDAFFGTVFTIVALVAAGFTISGVLRLRTEESALRAEPLLTTGTSRARWVSSWVTVTLAGSIIVLAAGGLGAGASYALVSGDADQVLGLTGAALAYVPATAVLGGAALLLFGWLPRGTGAAWGLLAVCFVIGWLGEVLSLPDWVLDLSPFTWTPRIPLDDPSALPLLTIALVAAALAAAGLTGFRRRDLVTA